MAINDSKITPTQTGAEFQFTYRLGTALLFCGSFLMCFLVGGIIPILLEADEGKLESYKFMSPRSYQNIRLKFNPLK